MKVKGNSKSLCWFVPWISRTRFAKRSRTILLGMMKTIFILYFWKHNKKESYGLTFKYSFRFLDAIVVFALSGKLMKRDNSYYTHFGNERGQTVWPK